MLSIPADRNVKPPPLDNRLYIIGDVELAFFKEKIGITDEEELKQHILTVQAKAYKVNQHELILGYRLTLGARYLATLALDVSHLYGTSSEVPIVPRYSNSCPHFPGSRYRASQPISKCSMFSKRERTRYCSTLRAAVRL